MPIVDCIDDDGCCPRGCSADDDGDCPGLCGNGVLDDGETCDDEADCPSSCDDGDACTVDELVGAAATCNAACISRPVVACVDGDGCCAVGCSPDEDDDCEAACGNGTLEPGERCDGDCAEACDDLDACHVGVLLGGASTCDARCEVVAIDVCADGDGCCPIGCTDAEDDDCPSSCEGGGSDVGRGAAHDTRVGRRERALGCR